MGKCYSMSCLFVLLIYFIIAYIGVLKRANKWWWKWWSVWIWVCHVSRLHDSDARTVTIISSAKESMFYPTSVCLSVCLSISVCLSVSNFTWNLLIGSSLKFYQRSTFGSHRNLDLFTGSFWSNFYRRGIGLIRHIFFWWLKNLSTNLNEIFLSWDSQLATNRSISVFVWITLSENF